MIFSALCSSAFCLYLYITAKTHVVSVMWFTVQRYVCLLLASSFFLSVIAYTFQHITQGQSSFLWLPPLAYRLPVNGANNRRLHATVPCGVASETTVFITRCQQEWRMMSPLSSSVWTPRCRRLGLAHGGQKGIREPRKCGRCGQHDWGAWVSISAINRDISCDASAEKCHSPRYYCQDWSDLLIWSYPISTESLALMNTLYYSYFVLRASKIKFIATLIDYTVD